MLYPRSNFAAIVIDDYIYAFGGNSGVKDEFHPQMPEVPCERFKYNSKNWEPVIIKKSPSIFAFGWSKFLENHQIIIYGGSDGSL
jgi:N-acetylneuraminic acid mutarotase